MEKELKITPPEGYEIDRENSTFDCIKFKKIKETSWREKNEFCDGWILDCFRDEGVSFERDYNLESSNQAVFHTKKQAKSALAMAKISQIMAHDKRFGGPVTDDEWADHSIPKYSIRRLSYGGKEIVKSCGIYGACEFYELLSFHTFEQLSLFLKENCDLVDDYLMVDNGMVHDHVSELVWCKNKQ
jgi:hypothetical protein